MRHEIREVRNALGMYGFREHRIMKLVLCEAWDT